MTLSPDPLAIARLKALVARILSEGDSLGRRRQIRSLQSEVWDTSEVLFSAELDELLRDLVYDLDFYEPDVVSRAFDRTYFGDDELEDRVRAALASPAWLDV